jgi:hypothetical protein
MITSRGLRTGGLMLLAVGLATAYASERGRSPVGTASLTSAPQAPEYLAGDPPPGAAALLSLAETTVPDTVGGVPVVRLSAAVLDAAPRLRSAPEPAIVLAGDESGDFDLHDADDVMLLGDARVATVAALPSRLLVFSLNGGEPRSVGRAGGGPASAHGF